MPPVRTGMVALAATYWMSSAPPRGTTRSMVSRMRRSSPRSARSVFSISWTAFGGPPGLDVLPVRAQDVGLVLQEVAGDAQQGPVFNGGREPRERTGGFAGGGALGSDFAYFDCHATCPAAKRISGERLLVAPLPARLLEHLAVFVLADLLASLLDD